MEIQLAIFDLAGTSVKDNYDVHRVLQSAMRKHGIEISIEQANQVMGIPKPIAIRDLILQSDQGGPVTDSRIENIHKDFVAQMIDFYRHDPSVSEIEGAAATFESLRSMGIAVCVNTGFDRLIAGVLLERLGWIRNGLIDDSVTSDEVERGRPYPDMILKLMAKWKIRLGRFVMKVGDTASDIREGRAAGCGLVVGVTTGAFSREALLNERPDYTVDHLMQVVELVEKG